MKYYSETQVKDLLEKQRDLCSQPDNKFTHYDGRGWFIHVDSILECEEPELPMPAITGSIKPHIEKV